MIYLIRTEDRLYQNDKKTANKNFGICVGHQAWAW